MTPSASARALRGGEDDMLTRKGVRSRYVFRISDDYKELILVAAADVRYYKLFQNPLLNADEVGVLIHDSWAFAKKQTGKSLILHQKIDAHVRYAITPCVCYPTERREI